ncbi:hypothetical protein [Microbacterium sp. GXF0217]
MTNEPHPSDSPQQEAVWYFPPKKNSSGKIWLISALAGIALAIAVVFLVFVLPSAFGPEASPSPTPTDSASPSPSPTATETPTPTPTPTPTVTPAPTPTPTPAPEDSAPPVPDPGVGDFAAQVQPVIDDAATGLQYAAEAGGEQAANDVGLLREDAERLSDTPPPSSIAADWASGVSNYLSALDNLQNAYRSGGDTTGAQSTATSALQTLRDIAGI